MLFGAEDHVLLKLLGLYLFSFLFICFLLIVACFLRCSFSFPSVDEEINGQDPSRCWVLHLLPGVLGWEQ